MKGLIEKAVNQPVRKEVLLTQHPEKKTTKQNIIVSKMTCMAIDAKAR